jgi:transcriptional regulator with XRE-family HTH domain
MLTNFVRYCWNLLNKFAVKKEDLARKVGKRIVQLRERKGWSQSDFARACMKDRQTIERIESGKTNPTIYTLYEIATVLEEPVSELLKV